MDDYLAIAQPLRKIVIMGGGTAGWLAAAAMAKTFGSKPVDIQLVEAADIGTIGVGEATIPPIVNFIRFLEIDERDFLAKTSATYKLAIRFDDWREIGEKYYHPFGSIGVSVDGKPFHGCWLKSCSMDKEVRYTDYSPAAVMCEHDRFYFPQAASKDSFLAGASYAWHFDASLVAAYMRSYAEARGVCRKEGRVVDVRLKDNGFIDRLVLHSGDELEADFFIDCSGFAGELIEKKLHAGYESWQEFLPCDRALAVPSENPSILSPYTRAHARDAGWTWQIPLQHRTGNGYVYAGQFCSDQQAYDTLMQALPGRPLAEPRLIPFVTGHRKKMWHKNCLALGLAAGFIEPLESTAIHLVMKGIRTFIELLPNQHCHEPLAREYNRIMLDLYRDIRDFVVLHYCTTRRTDSPFWLWCKTMTIPDSLKEKIELYCVQGTLYHNPDSLFKAPSWYSVFEGMGVRPLGYDPLIDQIDSDELMRVLKQVRGLMQGMAQGLPLHQQFLQHLLTSR